MRRAWLVVAWVAATALVSFGTFQALSSAQSGVGSGELSPVVVASTDVVTTAPSAPVTSVTSVPTTTATTVDSIGTTGATAPTSSSSTAPRPVVTTTTTEAALLETRTVESAGGSVTVRVAPGRVEFVGAVPLPGFSVEVEDAGPTRVRVEFENDVERHGVRIEWEAGELEVSLD